MGYEKALKAFEKTCQKLQVDYLDQYLIHFPGIPTDNRKKTQPTPEKAKELRLESWRALEKLYNEGKCKSIGVSNYMKRHLDEIVEANMTMPMVNQSEFHPYYNNKEIFDVCKEMGIVFAVINKTFIKSFFSLIILKKLIIRDILRLVKETY
jgi:diketogulonate reductase-like aldo/keto reductase